MNNDDSTKIGGLYYEIDADSATLDKTLDKSDKKVKEFGKNAGITGEQVKAGFNKVAIGLGAVGASFTILAKNATDFTKSAVSDAKGLAREIGTTTTEASRLTAAFGRVGVSADQARTSFGIFSKNIVAATQNTDATRLATEKLKLQIEATKREIAETTTEIKKQGDKSGDLNLRLRVLNNTLETQKEALSQTADGFSKLGVSTRDAEGKQKSFSVLLFEVADKFKEMPDGIDKTALSMELFGRSGRDMIKVLNLGSDGIMDLQKKADDLGLTLNEKTINNINELVKSQKDLKEQTDALQIAIGTATAPILTAFNTKLNEVLMSVLNTNGPMRDLTATFIAFAGPVFSGAAAVFALGANLVQLWPVITKVVGALTSLTALGIGAVIAGIAADIFLLVKAFQSVKDAMDAVRGAENAQRNLDKSNEAVNLRLEKLVKTGTPEQKARALNLMKQGFAGGTDYAPGGMAWVGEKGPELMYVPRGAQVIPSDVSKKVANNAGKQANHFSLNVNIGSVSNRSDIDYLVRQIDINQRRVLRGVSPA